VSVCVCVWKGGVGQNRGRKLTLQLNISNVFPTGRYSPSHSIHGDFFTFAEQDAKSMQSHTLI
jgi:hypothetical protein